MLSANLLAQTMINGNVSGLWETQGSPYQLTGNTTVAFGDTLVIENGVLVDLGVTFEFRVQGTLFATGALFQNGGEVRGDNGHLELNHCTFSGLEGGINIISGSAGIHGVRVDNTAETGISLSNVDSAFVRYSNISNSGDYGIKILQSDDVEVYHCLLMGNSVNDFNHPALFIDSSSPQMIEKNVIEDNHGQGIGVWSLTSVAAPVLKDNLIRRNFTGITVVNAPAYILDNIIVANYQEGNFNSGAGIFAGYGSSMGIVMGNYIGGNYYGVSIINEAAPNLGDMVNDYPGDDGLNLFYDNSFNGETWHIWNGTTATIMAQNNYWLEMDISDVDATLYDDEEGGGEVLFEPIYADPLPEPPDINTDGNINILDVVVLIEGFVDGGVPDPITFYLSDINHDFDLNVSDVVALIEIVVQ